MFHLELSSANLFRYIFIHLSYLFIIRLSKILLVLSYHYRISLNPSFLSEVLANQEVSYVVNEEEASLRDSTESCLEPEKYLNPSLF